MSRVIRLAALALVLGARCGTTNAGPDPAASASPRAQPTGKVEWVKMPADVAPASFIVSELARAEKDKKKLVIYVGATWCEPCQRFHEAANAGQLDAQFPDLRLIELDRDADDAILGGLACGSRLIPLFALPDPAGHCTDRRVEGGIKGEGAVAYIGPRLRTLLGPI